MNKDSLRGSIYVALGASSYDILATFVKLAYGDHFNTAEITVSQFVIGLAALFVLLLVDQKRSTDRNMAGGKGNVLKLILGGTSIGLTSIFFYSAVELIPVGLGIVLLMQSTWMSVVLELLLQKKAPDSGKVISTLIILAGTALAVDVFSNSAAVDWEGVIYGMLSALSYTVCMFASNNIAIGLPSLIRSFYLVLGGLIIVLIFSFQTITGGFSTAVFYTWGPVVAMFGTILPPLLFTRGMPLTGIGLGAIIASIELPVSIVFAYFVLGETITLIQGAGVAMIIAAVVIANH